MNCLVTQMDNVSAFYAEKLSGAGITTVGQLFEKGRSPIGRRDISFKSGLSYNRVCNWVNQIDICRIKGIGYQFAELLMDCGVTSVKDLATRNPEELHEIVKRVNSVKRVTAVTPNLKSVTSYVEQAQVLEPVVYS